MKNFVQNGIDVFDSYLNGRYQYYVTKNELKTMCTVLDEYNIPYSITKKQYTDDGFLLKTEVAKKYNC